MVQETPDPDRYFSGSYRQGRDNFLTACRRRGFGIDSRIHPDHKGPDGEDLAMDVVWIGPETASKVVVFSCGTHGLEAAAGSATMLRWLDIDGPAQLSDDMAVLLVHAVNPYGWAWSRRGNEDGIDLNRNFPSWADGVPANPAYAELHPALLETMVDEEGLQSFIRSFHSLAARKGLNYALNGITSGQYDVPDGLSYGGRAQSWSSRTLYSVAEAYLGNARDVLHVDWHTGIGAYGQAHFILDEGRESAAYDLLSRWWPDQTIHCDDVVEGVSITYNGILVVGLRQAVQAVTGARMVNVTIEWGTYEIERMVQALVMDNWLIHRAKNADLPFVNRIRAQLVELFYPHDPEWRRNVLSASERIYLQAIKGIQSWPIA
ncbi:MAG: DUF2817 domain-containing protein [Hyphomonas sp.]